MPRLTLRHAALPALVALALPLSACGSDSSSGQATAAAEGTPAAAAPEQAKIGGVGVEYENTGSGPMVKPTVPDTPSVTTEMGVKQGNVRKKNNQLVKPFGVGPGGKFPYDTINGKTGDASGGPIEIKKGDLVRIRVYNASQETHAMHLHGHDIIAVSKNGHAIPPVRETTQTVNPGDFYELEFRADNPGNWVFHCHFPHHTANGMASGYNGAPVGMTRVFSYKGYTPKVSPKYFSKSPSKSKTL